MRGGGAAAGALQTTTDVVIELDLCVIDQAAIGVIALRLALAIGNLRQTIAGIAIAVTGVGAVAGFAVAVTDGVIAKALIQAGALEAG